MNLLNHTTEVWLRGLFGGFIGGGATASTAWLGMIGAAAIGADVPVLNFKSLGVIFLSGAITNTLAFLKQSPLPPDDDTPETITPSLTKPD
jgi:hypothetical protein